MSSDSGWPASPRDDCYFCRDDCDVLEEHHIVPRRHGGGDENRNLVVLCPTCHQKIERLYDMRFYQSLGVGEPAGVVSHLSEYLITELNEVEIQVRRQLNETRERLEATHIHDESMSQDLREQIQDAVADYHAEDPEDDENTDENAESIKIKKVVRELQESHEDGAPVEKVYNRCLMRGLSEEEIEDRLKKLKDRADIYEPKTDHLRVV